MNTIVGVATPPGRSAIGVVRLSGPNALPIARALIAEEQFSPEPTHAVLKSLENPFTHEAIDQTLVTYFKAPHSFTGEDIVEISCHGSPVVLRKIIDLVLSLNARLADPGEFTLRALRNGKLNLSQAEAIRDLINAQTDAAARQALRQLSGELSARLEPIKEELVQIIVILESALEFVEEDLPQVQTQKITIDLARIASDIRELAASFTTGRLLREGLRVTIAGRPNVGKSSLFNKLLTSDRAIVTEIAGTTRDTLTEAISLKGVPILLTDTAGLREALDPIENLGVERTRQAIADADLLLVVLDGSVGLLQEDFEVLSQARQMRHVVVINKSDLSVRTSEREVNLSGKSKTKAVSALTGAGIEDLRAAILEPFASIDSEDLGLVVTNSRHYDLLNRVAAELDGSVNLLTNLCSEELVLVGLHNGLRFLGEITGETTSDDILARIFSTFCIGK